MVKKRLRNGKLKIKKPNRVKAVFKKIKIQKKTAGLLALTMMLTLLAGENPRNIDSDKSDNNVAYAAETEVDSLAGLPGRRLSEIDNSVLQDGMILIGAYLVYDRYLNDSIYNLAVDSMTRYNQPVMYYKSPMAGGDWLDLSTAVGLTDLRGVTGDYVKKSDIGDYKVCAIVDASGNMYTVDADGVTPGNIYDIQDPYTIMDLPDMVPLKLLYDGIASDVNIQWADNISNTLSNTDGRINQVYEKIWTARLLDTPLAGDSEGQGAIGVLGGSKNEFTDALDTAIINLNDVYTYYRNQGNAQYMKTIAEAIGQADAERRSEVYYMLAFDGAGKVYSYIQNRQYDKLMTKEEWAERFMVANWGENWRFNDRWASVIDEVVKANSRPWATWSSVDYNNIEKTLAYKYQEKYGISQDNVNALNYTSGGARWGVYNQSMFSVSWYKNVLNSVEQNGFFGTPEHLSALSYQNLIDTGDTNRYTIVYLARCYGWALSQAGDRLGDVRYWADRGNYQKAFENYISLMQRTGTTIEGGKNYTTDGYVVPDSGRLNSLLQRLETGADLSTELKKTYAMDSDYAEALKESISSCEQSYYKYSNSLLEDDGTMLGKAKYDTMRYLINNAGSQSADGVSADYNEMVVNYTSLKNISDDIIAEKQNELNLLNTTLLPQAEQNYIDGISALPSDRYNDAVADGQSEELQQGYLSEQKAALDGTLAEFEFLISARIKRIDINNRIPYIDNLLATAETYRTRVRTSAFSVKANDSIEEYIEWLNDQKTKCLNGSTGDLELDALESQRAAFEIAYKDALDNNDLDAAEEYKAALDDVLAKIAAIQDSALDSFMNGDVVGASDAANLLGGTPTALIEDIKKKAAEDIEDGDFSNIDTYISALGDLGGSDALDYLDTLLNDANASSELLNKLADAKEQAKGSAFNADGDGTGGTGNGTGGNGTGGNGSGTGGNGGDITGGNGNGGNGTGGNGNGDGTGGNGGDDSNGNGIDTAGYGDKNDGRYDPYNNAIYDLYGKDFDDLSDSDKASALTGVARFGYENGDMLAKQLAMLLLNQLLEEGNPFIYQKYMEDLNTNYINMAAIDRCRSYTGYRYIYKDGMDTLSQVGGSASYMFSVGSRVVQKSDGKHEDLTNVVVSQTDVTIDKYELKTYPYFVKEDSEHYIDVSCYYIPDVIYAVLIPQDVDERVEELLGA
ncbi:MAG: hypothetical protein J6P57_09560, partial [Lachnospiraceae bacterium]|nr:hypothetical protein [Lachnospiraceae bacterium]